MFFFFFFFGDDENSVNPEHLQATGAAEEGRPSVKLLTKPAIKKTIEQLKKKPKLYSSFVHYTTFEALKGILRTRMLLLSTGSKLNDLRECSSSRKWKKTYIASFSHEESENVAMWWMYGYKGQKDSYCSPSDNRIPIRLEFPKDETMAWLSEIASRNPFFPGNDIRKNRAKERPRLSILGDCSFHNVLYQGSSESKDAISETDAEDYYYLPQYENSEQNEQLTSYVKDAGWQYEKETRLAVFLWHEEKMLDRIAVPFDPMIQSMRVLVGPCEDIERKTETVRNALTNSGIAFKQSNLVQSSIYRFKIK